MFWIDILYCISIWVLIALNKIEILHWRKWALISQNQRCNVNLPSLSIWPIFRALWKTVGFQEPDGLIFSVIRLTLLVWIVLALLALHSKREEQTLFFGCLLWWNRTVASWHKMSINSFIKLMKMSPGERKDPITAVLRWVLEDSIPSAAVLRLCHPRTAQAKYITTILFFFSV